MRWGLWGHLRPPGRGKWAGEGFGWGRVLLWGCGSREGACPEPPPPSLSGLPNAGKSSVLNALVGRSAVSVSRAPGRTRYFQTHFLTPRVRLCDCPGLVFPSCAPPALQVGPGPLPAPASQRHPPLSLLSPLHLCVCPHPRCWQVSTPSRSCRSLTRPWATWPPASRCRLSSSCGPPALPLAGLLGTSAKVCCFLGKFTQKGLFFYYDY